MRPRFIRDVAPFSKDGRKLLDPWTLAPGRLRPTKRYHTQLGSYLGSGRKEMEQ